MPEKNNKYWSYALIGIVALLGFWLRFNGLSNNYSFWIDEASSATFARAIIEQGTPVLPTGYAANDYVTHFYLMALSFKIFGLNEFAARFPSVVFGALTIFAVFLLGTKFGGKKVGLVAGILTAFSVLEIVYSRQARSYQELQFFYVLSAFFFFLLLEAFEDRKFKVKLLLFFVVSSLLLFLTHKFGLLFFVEIIIYLLLFRTKLLIKYLREIVGYINQSVLRKILACLLLAFLSYILLKYFNFYKAFTETTGEFWAGKFGLSQRQYFDIIVSHVKYYHSLFWRQYPHITILAFFGLILGLKRNYRFASFFIAVLLIHFIFVTTRVFPQFVRYVYLVFPFILISASCFLVWVSENIVVFKNKNGQIIFLAIIVLFILINGNKFSTMPKEIYSLNMDMAEVPEPDFKNAYQDILDKTKGDLRETIIIDNRTDAAEWYLGEGKPDYYLVGPKEMEPSWNLAREVVRDPVSGALYLDSLEHLKKIIDNNHRGFVIFEERALEYVAVDISMIEFVKSNLKFEKRIEHIKNNNLSVWPIEIYSWGF